MVLVDLFQCMYGMSMAQEVKGVMQPFDIAGPLCFAGDYLAHGAQLPQATAEGHWLSISATGANTYGLWPRHCSRSVPKYLCWDGKNYVFGVNAKQSIINLTFEEQVEINEEIIFTLNGCFLVCPHLHK